MWTDDAAVWAVYGLVDAPIAAAEPAQPVFNSVDGFVVVEMQYDHAFLYSTDMARLAAGQAMKACITNQPELSSVGVFGVDVLEKVQGEIGGICLL